MYKTLYPVRDATLYERHEERNTGADQILELTKITEGNASEASELNDEYWDGTYNTRMLLQFDLSTVSQSIVQGKINANAQYYLTIKATEAESLMIEYSVYAYAVSGSWTNGTGFYGNNPQITNGVSWKWRDGRLSSRLWETGSLSGNVTASFATTPGGGVWYTGSGYEASQSFNYEAPDIRMDVTSIVRTWLSGSVPNHGFLVKFPTANELDTSVLGTIKFFSRDTHTIFIPRLEVYWDDSDLSGTGSFTEVSDEDFVLHLKNLRESYNEGEKPKIRITCRDRFPTPTYATSSNYLTAKRLPTGSYFSILDAVTDEVMIPFDTTGTKVNCDTSGNYIKLDIASLLPERYYKLMFKSEFDGGDTIKYIDDGYLFKVYRQ
jgi:hypothetical protein